MKPRLKIRMIAAGCVVVLLLVGLTIYCNMPFDYDSQQTKPFSYYMPFDYDSQQTKHSSFRLNVMGTPALIESFLRNVPGNKYQSYAPETQDEFVRIWLEDSDILQELLTRKNIGKALWDFYDREKPFRNREDFKDLSDSFRFDALEILLASSVIQEQFTQEEKQELERLVLAKMEERREYPAVYVKSMVGYCSYFGFRQKAPGYE